MHFKMSDLWKIPYDEQFHQFEILRGFFLSRKQADYSANSVASEAQIVAEQDAPIRLRKQKNAEVAEQRNRISLGPFFCRAGITFSCRRKKPT